MPKKDEFWVSAGLGPPPQFPAGNFSLTSRYFTSFPHPPDALQAIFGSIQKTSYPNRVFPAWRCPLYIRRSELRKPQVCSAQKTLLIPSVIEAERNVTLVFRHLPQIPPKFPEVLPLTEIRAEKPCAGI